MNQFSLNLKFKTFFIFFAIVFNTFAIDFDFRGQLSGWVNTMNHQNSWDFGSGVLYIPQVDLYHNLTDESFLNSELSLKGYFSTDFEQSNHNLDFYRFNLRYATNQSETQIGLQKISFGPAMLLRSLMWFDQVDVRDPLRLTNGVYALR